MTGVSLPDSMSFLSRIRSLQFCLATKVPSFWSTNRDSIVALSWRSVPPSHLPPPSPPTMTRVPADVQDQVIAPLALGEVLARVVDDMIRPDRANHLHLLGAANSGDVRAERLGDLHGKGANATRGADDQHLLLGR